MKPIALITGASSGIGADFARVFAANGHSIIITARRTERLAALADEIQQQHDVSVYRFAADLADPHGPQQLFQQVEAAHLKVGVLVNNAGFAAYGPFHELSLAEQLGMIQLNISALTALTHLFLVGMRERKMGHILNMASTAAFQPGPLMAVYYATKSYVLHFSEALNYELKGSGVSVTTLCPGPTTTEFQARAAMESSRLVQNNLMSSRTVAEIGYQALMAERSQIVPGFRNWLLATAVRFLPRDMVTRMANDAQLPVGH